jgi:hypothetical protein
MTTPFQLRFPAAELPYWANLYNPANDAGAATTAAAARARGYLTHDDLLALGRWKSPRSGPRLAANDPAYVEAVTAAALSTPNERLRVDVLRLLSGVAWPTASVILHWCHADRYPILDFRALWTLGHDTLPPYDFALWQAYTAHCRELADGAGMSMRELDRALWQYSWENQ